MSKIKCPKCGSTLAPEMIYLDSRSNITEKKDAYFCWCGTQFEVVFEMTAVNILEEN